MSTVQEILNVKGTHVLSIGLRATVLDAAVLMNDNKIGALVVIDHGQVVGIFTERDVLRRVVAERRDPADAMVEEVMTADVVCCEPRTSLDEASSVMKQRRIRHLPVCGPNNSLAGLVSIGDLNAYHSYVQETTIHQMHEYLHGRA
ncbi:MAG TPA: CBS domain-containing protein [Gemmataceae bacterium]|jgi:CBS domain-containing protein|nr:CBS domain-containing protein [Gemmataceae bacterium]